LDPDGIDGLVDVRRYRIHDEPDRGTFHDYASFAAIPGSAAICSRSVPYG
jgi:hypothetical protein